MKKPFDRNVWVIAIHDGAGGVDIFCGLNQMQTKAKTKGGQFCLYIYSCGSGKVSGAWRERLVSRRIHKIEAEDLKIRNRDPSLCTELFLKGISAEVL